MVGATHCRMEAQHHVCASAVHHLAALHPACRHALVRVIANLLVAAQDDLPEAVLLGACRHVELDLGSGSEREHALERQALQQRRRLSALHRCHVRCSCRVASRRAAAADHQGPSWCRHAAHALPPPSATAIATGALLSGRGGSGRGRSGRGRGRGRLSIWLAAFARGLSGGTGFPNGSGEGTDACLEAHCRVGGGLVHRRR